MYADSSVLGLWRPAPATYTPYSMYPELPPSDPLGQGPQQPPQQPLSPLETELEETASSIFSTVGAIFSWVVLPLALVALLHNFVFQAYRVVGSSMQPTLQENEYLIISKLQPSKDRLSDMLGRGDNPYIPKRGEIIVFRFPKEPDKTFVKRVVGVPGDRVVVRDGILKVYNDANPSGFTPDTEYLPKDTFTLIETDEVIEPGNVFVVGDNRTPGGSYDSREWGELPSEFIVGNAVVRLLPLDKVKVL